MQFPNFHFSKTQNCTFSGVVAGSSDYSRDNAFLEGFRLRRPAPRLATAPREARRGAVTMDSGGRAGHATAASHCLVPAGASHCLLGESAKKPKSEVEWRTRARREHRNLSARTQASPLRTTRVASPLPTTRSASLALCGGV